MEIFVEVALVVLGGVFSVMFWLLKSKDASQGDQIRTLFDKHDADAARLHDLEIKIAANHYVKPELDNKFDKLEGAFTSGIAQLGAKFDMLANAILNQGAARDHNRSS